MAKKMKKPKPVKKVAVQKKKRGGLRPAPKKKAVQAKPKRRARPAYKSVNMPVCTIEQALMDAFSAFEELRDEMNEICDNMSGMEHLPKYQVAEDASSELDSHTDAPEVPKILQEKTISTLTEMVPTRKGRATGRGTRLSNAQQIVNDVVDFLDAAEGFTKEEVEAAKELSEELSEHQHFDVEFPGMYG